MSRGHQHSLTLKKSLLGENHPQVATTLHNLGMIAREQRDFATAQAHLELALERTVAHVGPDHPRVANVLSELAATQLELGERARAVASAARALEILADQPRKDADLVAELERTLAAARQPSR